MDRPERQRGDFCLRLILSRVSFAYPEQPVLMNNISASIETGDRVALIGANGSGKSTLLALLLGQLQPMQGHIQNPWHPRAAVLNPAGKEASWGQAAWQEIAASLVQAPRFLVLDEPTRHLDERHRQQLATWLNRMKDTTMVVVSHDLEFLDAIATHTWHLDSGQMTVAAVRPGEHLRHLEAERESYQRRYQQQQAMIERLTRDIQDTKEQARRTEQHTIDSGQRRYAKKVAKKARAREKRLDHWESSGEKLEAPRDPHILRHTWEHVASASGTLIRLEDSTIAYESSLFEHLFLEVRAGDRIGIVGDNGAGKSSLMEALLGRFPGRVVGHVRMPAVPYAYIQQVFEGDSHETAWEYFQRLSSLATGLGRAWLQSYGFAPGHLERPLTALSQGEQVKLQIAAWSASGVPLMALDEPEHHLDWPSLNAVSRGLAHYPGTLLVISHQRRFLDALFIKTLWTISEGRVAIKHSE